MRGIDRYRTQRVDTSSPEQIVLMLFQEAVKRLTLMEGFDATDPHWGPELHHVRSIFTELRAGLDHTVAPELTARLSSLYAWCIKQLIEVHGTRSSVTVGEVNQVAITLLEGWQGALAQPMRQSA